MRRFVVADIHGRYEALREVLDKSGFNYENDKLIILGDIADGGRDVSKCVDELLKIKNRVFVLGNHDDFFINWYLGISNEERKYLRSREQELRRAERKIENYQVIKELIWTSQGGWATIKSYETTNPDAHKNFWLNHVLYHIEDNMLFVHGGFYPSFPIEKQEKQTLLWDRELIEYAFHGNIGTWKRIFIGHSATVSKRPEFYHNLVMCDCGGGWEGHLAIVNVDNPLEYWLSKKQKPCR